MWLTLNFYFTGKHTKATSKGRHYVLELVSDFWLVYETPLVLEVHVDPIIKLQVQTLHRMFWKSSLAH